MKKLYKTLLFSVTALLSLPASAQLVSAYYFTQYQGTYSAVSGGTVFGSTLNDDERFVNPTNLAGGTTNSGPGFPIGFNFTYNNAIFDRFAIDANGWISLGQSTLTPNPVNTQIAAAGSDYEVISSGSSAPANLQCRIAGFCTDLAAQSGSELRAQTIGATPNRTLVVQWTNYSEYSTSGQSMSFQIMLLETSNKVDIVYGTFTTGSAGTAQVGLRGQAATNFNNRRVTVTGTWAASIAGAQNTQICNFAAGQVPASGQTFEWAIPQPCGATPVAAIAVPNVTTACPGSVVNLSLSSVYTSSTGITFQWQSSTTGTNGAYSNITTGTGSGTAAAIGSPTLSGNTSFRAIVTCANNSSSIIATPVEVITGAPATSSAVTNNSMICSGSGANLSLSSNYSGVGYQWQQSQTGVPGSYTSISNGTTNTLPVSNVTTTTFYQAVLSCTAAATSSVLSSAVSVNVIPTVTNTVPYLETFEGIQNDNDLPNCQWSATNLNDITYTYIAPSGFDNQVNHTPGGTKYASFSYGASDDAFFSNGIYMQPGVTYSAAIWYITDGYGGWTNLSVNFGHLQSIASLTTIATISVPTNTVYSLLSGTFTVPTAGLYYMGVKCNSSFNPDYLTWDDLSVTAPCTINQANFSVNAPTVVCSGNSAVITATAGAGVVNAADTYSWNNGSQTNSISVTPLIYTTYSVTGTSTAGCVGTKTIGINVNALPTLSVFATPTAVCQGETVSQAAIGALVSYTWSTGDNTPVISQIPTTTTTYTVSGTGANGCVNSIEQTIVVNDPPTVSAATTASIICKGKSAGLQASGSGNTYVWTTGATSFESGQTITVSPTITTVYTLTTTDANGCTNSTTLEEKVDICQGIATQSGNSLNANVYPNPNTGEFNIALDNGLAKNVEVMDVTGRIIFSGASADNMLSVNINKFAAGIYYVKIQSDNKTDIVKIVKQ